MNIKKTIIFTGLSLLLSSTFNSGYSADGDETNKPIGQSFKRPLHEISSAAGFAWALSSESSAGKMPGDAHLKSSSVSFAWALSSESNRGKMPGDAHLKSSSAVISDMHEDLKHTLLWRAVNDENVEMIDTLLANTAIGNVPEELNHRIMRIALKDENQEMMGLSLANTEAPDLLGWLHESGWESLVVPDNRCFEGGRYSFGMLEDSYEKLEALGHNLEDLCAGFSKFYTKSNVPETLYENLENSYAHNIRKYLREVRERSFEGTYDQYKETPQGSVVRNYAQYEMVRVYYRKALTHLSKKAGWDDLASAFKQVPLKIFLNPKFIGAVFYLRGHVARNIYRFTSSLTAAADIIEALARVPSANLTEDFVKRVGQIGKATNLENMLDEIDKEANKNKLSEIIWC
jgi:hypothetical protein